MANQGARAFASWLLYRNHIKRGKKITAISFGLIYVAECWASWFFFSPGELFNWARLVIMIPFFFCSWFLNLAPTLRSLQKLVVLYRSLLTPSNFSFYFFPTLVCPSLECNFVWCYPLFSWVCDFVLDYLNSVSFITFILVNRTLCCLAKKKKLYALYYDAV